MTVSLQDGQAGDVEKGAVWVWMCSLGISVCLLMLAGLLGVIFFYGAAAFWPREVMSARLADGSEIWGQVMLRRQVRDVNAVRTREEWQWFVGNEVFSGGRFRFLDREQFSEPQLAVDVWVLEPLQGGRLFGLPMSLELPGQSAPLAVSDMSAGVLRSVWLKARALQAVVERLENTELRRLAVRIEREKRPGRRDDEKITVLEREFEEVLARVREKRLEAQAAKLNVQLANGRLLTVPLADVVEVVNPGKENFWGKCGIYFQRWWRFLTGWPRVANTEGGIFPAIFGTLVMTVLMSVAVVPLGVLAAIYLREYARPGPVLSTVKICVNNLAGVPSIVFGVFGLGFFVYAVGGTIDDLFFQSRKPVPVFGTGGILWASLTLALLTLPVVIVAAEEALGAVSRSLKEGALACGATKWQMIWRVVLPASLPGILTGVILAMARGAGEVAPLMITGVVKLAPSLPVDDTAPFLHLDRKFMHLGFHIYDLGFQSPDSEAARPLAFAATLVLIVIVGLMNLGAVVARERLRRRLRGTGF